MVLACDAPSNVPRLGISILSSVGMQTSTRVFRSALLGVILLISHITHADPVVGDKWSSFQLKDTQSQAVEWKPGRVTVISFCAFWCDTWKLQAPRIAAARNVTNGLPVDYLTISIDGRWSEIAKNNQGLPLWLDGGGEWSKSRGVDRVPTTVVLDPAGEIRYVGGTVIRQQDITDAVHAASQPKLDAGILFLTFDDFPARAEGDDLLDVLRALDVKATFFCIGSRVEQRATLLKRARAEGHSIQCHSWDHDASNPQLEQCRTIFKHVLGIEPTLYRAPGSEKIEGEQTHHPVIDPYDYQRPTKKELERRILSSARDQAIIQLHAGVSVTLESLPEIIANLKRRGFRFECL